ncbi:hypothetical protein Goklo_017572, partial [Gossypium klotzschianum]|nr:hypothetical protein [Gossypium klotzschianum]
MEGSSITYPPMLENDNYTYWKARMKAYTNPINEKAWRSVLTVYQAPTIDLDVGKASKLLLFMSYFVALICKSSNVFQ